MQIQINNKISYFLNQKLGEGTFGKVYKGFIEGQMGDKIDCAVKIISNQKNNKPAVNKYYENELAICEQIKDHCIKFYQKNKNKDKILNIVQIYDVIIREDEAYIVMEYCDQTLETYKFTQFLKRFSLVEAMSLSKQIINGVKFLHKINIIHRDIKPDNIFVQFSQNPQKIILKIGDYNISKELVGLDQFTDSVAGTINYMAPEMVHQIADKESELQPYNKKVDMWAIGVIIHEMLTGCSLFVGNYPKPVASEILKFGSYLQKWKKCNRFEIDKIPKNITIEIRRFLSYYNSWKNINSEKVAHFIDRFLKSSHLERITAKEALKQCEQLIQDEELKLKQKDRIKYEIEKREKEIKYLNKDSDTFFNPIDQNNNKNINKDINSTPQTEKNNDNIDSAENRNQHTNSETNIDETINTQNPQKNLKQLIIESKPQQNSGFISSNQSSIIKEQDLPPNVNNLNIQLIDKENILIHDIIFQKQLHYFKVQNGVLEDCLKEIEKEKKFLKEQVILDIQTKKEYNSQQQDSFLIQLQKYNQQLLDQINKMLRQDNRGFQLDNQIFQNVTQFLYQPIQSRIIEQIKYIIESNKSIETYLLPQFEISQNGDQHITYKTYKNPKQNTQHYEEMFINLIKYFKKQKNNQFKNLIPIYEIQIDKQNNLELSMIQSDIELKQIAQKSNYFTVGFLHQDRTLEDYIRSLKEKNMDHENKQIILQKLNLIEILIRAIHNMHSQGILHGSLNTRNILNSLTDQQFKISFYSIHEGSQSKIPKQDMINFENSYMSPDQHRRQINCKEDDIWSLGAIIHYILTFSPLFQSNSYTKEIILSYNQNYFVLWEQCYLYRSSTQEKQAGFSKHIQKASELLYKVPDKQTAELIGEMLSANQRMRPNIEEVQTRFGKIKKQYEDV